MTGDRWPHGAARALLQAAIDERLDHPTDRRATLGVLARRFGPLPRPGGAR